MWPIFHGTVILSYISKTIWCMSVIYSDNETVWPKLWPQSKYKSTWHIFHDLVNLLNIFQDYLMDEHHSWYEESVWHIDTLSSRCRSLTYICDFHLTENSDIIVLHKLYSTNCQPLMCHWDKIFYLCPVNSSHWVKISVQVYNFQWLAHQSFTTGTVNFT